MAAEDHFDLDDGGVVVLTSAVPDAERRRVEEAARTCLVSAIRVEDQ